jgi:PD-(D/E)XK nuclease superfamily protein
MPALYEDGGKRVTTHSMLKTYLRCPKQAQYKYAERLKPRAATMRDKPLKRGTWVHELLEVHYQGGDWRERHSKLTKKFNQLFDEEKDNLGDLPTECAVIMRSYLWHYGADKTDPMHGWKILGTEVTFEAVWPDSEDGLDIYRCRLDLLVEDEYGFLIVDHKTHKQLPDHTTRTLDAASPLYIWAARENGYDVRGFLWNYLRTKAPSSPKMAYVGKANQRLSQGAIDTDYPTYARGINQLALQYDFDWRADENIVAKLRSLKADRWAPGKIQTSPWFRRETLEKDDQMVARTVARMMKTRDRMHNDYDDYDIVELSSDRSCSWCSFRTLCEVEEYGGNADIIRRKTFRVGDPLDYYQDQKDQTEAV